MLQPSLEHTTSFDVDAPPTSSTGTLRSGASLVERMKGLFSTAMGTHQIQALVIRRTQQVHTACQLELPADPRTFPWNRDPQAMTMCTWW